MDVISAAAPARGRANPAQCPLHDTAPVARRGGRGGRGGRHPPAANQQNVRRTKSLRVVRLALSFILFETLSESRNVCRFSYLKFLIASYGDLSRVNKRNLMVFELISSSGDVTAALQTAKLLPTPGSSVQKVVTATVRVIVNFNPRTFGEPKMCAEEYGAIDDKCNEDRRGAAGRGGGRALTAGVAHGLQRHYH
ncbi:hypothetical protein EVAR_96165_1 [Eumeta japonica]|uniref:Uncharacterized protein n=1 Tax=Eumeta variegata TaxID=151549 RepID=A0A4C1VIZ2_EUMVA|nr:hypothetical protein EVAR_96165_1 [Eumeta japonica]